MYITMRATIVLAISLIGFAIVLTGITGGIARVTAAGNTGSVHNVSVLAGGPGSAPSGNGFTWG